jgi:hypothetical protein
MSNLWTAIGLGGFGAVLGAGIAGYIAVSNAAPSDCVVHAFNEGLFTYFCSNFEGVSAELQFVPAEPSSYAFWMILGAVPGTIYTLSTLIKT